MKKLFFAFAIALVASTAHSENVLRVAPATVRLTDQTEPLPQPLPEQPTAAELRQLLSLLQRQQPPQPEPPSASDLSQMLSILQRRPAQATPSRGDLSVALAQLQSDCPGGNCGPPPIDQRALLLALQQLYARDVVVERELPAIVQEHNYQLPAYFEEREIIAPPRRPVVDVRLRKSPNCLSRFLGNLAAMFRDDPPCRVDCGCCDY